MARKMSWSAIGRRDFGDKFANERAVGKRAKSRALNAALKGDSKKMLEHKAQNRRLRHESFKEMNNFK